MAGCFLHVTKPQLLLFSEEREIDRTVGAVVNEVRMGAEVVVLAMFDNEQTTLFKQFVFEYEVWNICNLFESIRRVGEDDAELHCAFWYELEHVGMDGFPSAVIEFARCFEQELKVLEVFFHADYLGTSTGHELKSDSASTAKEVERTRLLVKVDIYICQDVEQTFLCEVGCWACLECAWHVESLMLVFSSDYSHYVGVVVVGVSGCGLESAYEQGLQVVGNVGVAACDSVAEIFPLVDCLHFVDEVGNLFSECLAYIVVAYDK